MPASEIIAVALSVLEFTLGVLLIEGAYAAIVSMATMVVLALFTIITLLSATVLPIGDCGCFGDALKLSPWATFFKNIVMLPMAFMLWRYGKREAGNVRRDVMMLVVALLIPLFINIYSLRHLPLVDFMPYKVGVNLRERVLEERIMQQESVRSQLRFRDKLSGEVVCFDATDSSCWTNDNLEYVDAVTTVDELPEMLYSEFLLYNSEDDDVSTDVLQSDGRVVLLCINDAESLDDRCMRGIENLYSQYPASYVYVLSAASSDEYNVAYESERLMVDAMTLRAIIRADVGVLVLNDGVVEFKANICDI